MKPEDWDAGFGRSIGMFLNGNGIRGMDTRGQRVVDDSFLLLFNAHDEGMDWVLPPEEFAPAWRLVIDTSGVPDLPETDRRRQQRGGRRARAWSSCRRLAERARGADDPGHARPRRVPTDRARAGADARRIRGRTIAGVEPTPQRSRGRRPCGTEQPRCRRTDDGRRAAADAGSRPARHRVRRRRPGTKPAGPRARRPKKK